MYIHIYIYTDIYIYYILSGTCNKKIASCEIKCYFQDSRQTNTNRRNWKRRICNWQGSQIQLFPSNGNL